MTHGHTLMMRRRNFLLAGAAAFSCSHAAAQARRTTRVVTELRPISKDRREKLVLGDPIPELDDIEVRNDFTSPPPKKILRLSAWNSERGRWWREGGRLIQEHPALHDTDILFLGEMDLGMARSGNRHTTREMAAALRMNYAYGVEFLEFTNGEKEEREQYPGENEWGYHGNAILSRYPLRALRMLRFPGIEKWWGDYQKRLGGRMALLATIRIGRDITLVSTHLESSKKDVAARKLEAEMLAAELRSQDAGRPVLLGGDLNAPPDEPLFADLKKVGLRVEECNDLTAGTVQRIVDGKWVLREPHIDYICIRGVRVIRDEISPKVVPAVYPPAADGRLLADHAIVTVKVELP